MWKCPNCGREFKNAEQNHYCLIKPKTIDEYIALQADEKRADLYLLRKILKDALPEAEERISWSMPTYWKNHNIFILRPLRNTLVCTRVLKLLRNLLKN